MRDHIEFDAKVIDGEIIKIPAEYSRELEKSELVHVTISSRAQARRTVQRMLNNPPFPNGYEPLKREDIYGRD